jgi:predicted dehydrogenase
MIRVGIIGYGYWGPNIVRNFVANDRTEMTMVCDTNQGALDRVKKLYPGVQVTREAKDVFSSPKIDAVAIITPVSTHFEMAKQALLNGKHVFVEKPLTATVAQAEELVELAEKKRLKIMVDHTFLFTGAVSKIMSLVESGKLGNLYYYDSMRVNLGLLQKDINVIWDLAPHDLSIMDYIIEEEPVAFLATGKAHVNGMENVAYITAYFNNNMIAHFNLSWLSPVKIRLTLIGGEKRMVVWDDVAPDEKIKVYDKGAEVKNGPEHMDEKRKLLVSYRSGDTWIPKVEQTEALKLVVEDFVEYVLNDKSPINDGYAGLRIVKMLEASNRSLANKGKMVYV